MGILIPHESDLGCSCMVTNGRLLMKLKLGVQALALVLTIPNLRCLPYFCAVLKNSYCWHWVKAILLHGLLPCMKMDR